MHPANHQISTCSVLIRESQAGGMLRKASAQVVGDLLEFGDRTAGEIMVPRVRVAALRLRARASSSCCSS